VSGVNSTWPNYVNLFFFMLLLQVSAAAASLRQSVQVAVADTSLSDISLCQRLAVESLTLCSLLTVVSVSVWSCVTRHTLVWTPTLGSHAMSRI
jgi:hypothetical protein